MERILGLLFVAVVLVACGNGAGGNSRNRTESREAKTMLQGVWIDEETEEVVFRAEGDTIFYPDSTSQAAYFRIVDDSLVLGSQGVSYHIEKQTAHVFWFSNQNGDLVKLAKSDNPDDDSEFVHDDSPKVLTLKILPKLLSLIAR